MFKKLNLLVCLSLLVILTGCGDTKPPTAIVNNFTLKRNVIYSEDVLIGKMVTNISDNNEITLSQPVDIANYSDIDFSKIGSYDLNFVVSDDAGNKSNYSATLTIEATDSEMELIAFETTVEDYKNQINEFADLKLSTEEDIEALESTVERLTKEDYLRFQERLDETQAKLYNTYVSENDLLLARNYELINQALTIDPENQELLVYQEELDDIDLSEDDLLEQAKIYSHGLKIEDALGTKLVELEIEHTGIDEELLNNSFLQVSTCNYNVTRAPNVKVNIGVGDRKYYAYTNQYSQLVFITADQIEIQNESSEAVGSNGQYCDGPAAIEGTSGTTPKTIIADSLGAASNSYNVIPAGSAYSGLESLENEILANGGATEFKAYFSYPDSSSTTPSLIDVSFKIDSNLIEYQFNN